MSTQIIWCLFWAAFGFLGHLLLFGIKGLIPWTLATTGTMAVCVTLGPVAFLAGLIYSNEKSQPRRRKPRRIR